MTGGTEPDFNIQEMSDNKPVWQLSPIQPGAHPLEHSPFFISHMSSPKQWHWKRQSTPNVPGMYSEIYK